MIDRYTYPEMKRVWSEENKLQKWLDVEIHVCEAWARRGVIPAEDMESIRRAQLNPERMAELFSQTHHDIVSFVRSVAETVGPAGRFIHLGLTSSDVLDTAMALQVGEASEILDRDLAGLEEALVDRARTHKYAITIGRTHGIHAEPTTFGLKLAGWVAEVRRGRERLNRATCEMKVGKISGAVGTHANVPPDIEEEVCAALGLAVEPVSTQIVHRDRHAAYIACLGVIASSLEKFATELRALQRTDIAEAFEPFSEGQQGSSAMPHKRNPELAERVCGLARFIRGAAVPAMENVALWHERDISHSSVERLIFPDSCLALDYILRIFAHIVRGMDVDEARMRQNLDRTRGLVYSGRVLLALIDKGMARNDAYELVQRYAKRVWAGDAGLQELLASDPTVTQLLPIDELGALFDAGYHLRHVDTAYERLGIS
ncbi:MAG TPA: adenylosuccinate lyase [Chloroflexota bacterium]|nr:adenylosuccinate lyase [Chloroflexota bacterium]